MAKCNPYCVACISYIFTTYTCIVLLSYKVAGWAGKLHSVSHFQNREAVLGSLGSHEMLTSFPLACWSFPMRLCRCTFLLKWVRVLKNPLFKKRSKVRYVGWLFPTIVSFYLSWRKWQVGSETCNNTPEGKCGQLRMLVAFPGLIISLTNQEIGLIARRS